MFDLFSFERKITYRWITSMDDDRLVKVGVCLNTIITDSDRIGGCHQLYSPFLYRFQMILLDPILVLLTDRDCADGVPFCEGITSLLTAH